MLTTPRREELEGLLTVARFQLEQARRLKLRELIRSLRYDINKWESELAGEGEK